MSLSLNFNATSVEPASADFELVPTGWYQLVLEKTELKPTKAGNGALISFQAKIQGPTHANRVVFGNINYQNPNPQAQEIGQRQLSALCHAVGVLNLSNVEQLCGIPFEGRVGATKPTYNVKGDVNSGIAYEAKNEIVGFRAVGSATGVGAASSAPAAPPAAPQTAPQPAPQPAVQQTVQPAPQPAAQPAAQPEVAHAAPQQAIQHADQAIAGVANQAQPW